jgi:hypothetical protein
MSIAKHHAEWLSLIEVSGPFLSLPVLVQHFPQGMDAHDPEHAKALRQVYEEWDRDQHDDRPDPAIHRQWIDWVLRNTLDLGDVLVEGQKIAQTLKADPAEHGETLRPDKVVMERDGSTARLLIQTYPLRQKLSRVVEGKPWAASPDTRMMQLLHDTGVRLGLVTNGDQWMLVDAPQGDTTGYISWYASLWLDEPKTLQAFRTLLSSYRFFGVPWEETLERLLAQSAEEQQEVTDQLGYQVRQAVEVLVRSIDRANRDSGGALLKGVPEESLYEAALTVMMRLVFLFCAEERELLLLGDELYDDNYAVSTVREQLRVTANEFGEEVLERRHDAWSRLLSTFRAVYAGVQHERLKLPAYKGELFDPDRFPFLEGRSARTSWNATPSLPITVDNRTTLHLLEALQVLQVRLPGGGPATPRKLSFRALSILQIGHVYEGLLDHTAVKATEPVLGLSGPRDHEPEVPLARLEALAAKGEDELLSFVKDGTGRSSVSPLKKLLSLQPHDLILSRFRTVCHGNEQLWQRIKPFAGLVRLDTFDYPVVVLAGSVYVTAGTDRRSSGTHYTPESLTAPIVRYTLEPLVYEGPSEGKPREQWRLRSPKELLDLKICDMACGSGAFLVQVCVYLAERLLEAWGVAEKQMEGSPRITPYGEVSTGAPEEQLIPLDREERLTYARRLVAERCVYGVDKNPLAVEMAKLSLWLLTLAKDKPFTFLDHAIRCGDSLVGLRNIDQLLRFSMTENAKVRPLMEQQRQQIEKRLQATMLLRQQIETQPSNTPQDIERKTLMLANVEDQTKRLRYAADMLLAVTWEAKNPGELEASLNGMLAEVEYKFKDLPAEQLGEQAEERLRKANIKSRFHWPLEFPEVLMGRLGFDGFVSNPPFMHGSWISSRFGNPYADFLKRAYSLIVGKVDYVLYFLHRAASLVREKGCFGLILTGKASEGDARKVGFQALIERGYSIYQGRNEIPWPGSASILVCMAHVFRGRFSGPLLNSHLATEAEQESALPLLSNSDTVFVGAWPGSLGFVLSEYEHKIAMSEERNHVVVRPLFSGSDLNALPVLEPPRYIIDFGQLTSAEASSYEYLWGLVESRVKPEKEKIKRKAYREKWWQYCEPQFLLFRIARATVAVIAMSRVSKHFIMRLVPTGGVYTDKVIVFVRNGEEDFAVLSSEFHNQWAIGQATTHGSGTAEYKSYKPSECGRTFPFPAITDADAKDKLKCLGIRLNGLRERVYRATNAGPTATYNRFHDPDETAADIQELRDLHVEMDKAVAAAYGWSDLKLGHGFHETKQGLRFTISESARREVLARLLKLNHARYAEEVAQGLHDKGKGKRKATGRKGNKPPSSDEKLLF